MILRIGVEQATLGWTPPPGGIIDAYIVHVSRNGGPEEFEAVVPVPQVTLEVNPFETLVASIVAVGRLQPGGPLTASPRSPPSDPIYFVPAPGWAGPGFLILHCPSCHTIQARSLSTPANPLVLGGFPDPWRLVGAGPIATPERLELLWRHGDSRTLRLVSGFGGPTTPPLAVSSADLRGFEVIGLAEIDGDGTREIMLRPDAGTTLQFWKASGGTLFAAGEIPAPQALPLAGAADVDGDRISELWWQGAVPGRLYIWKVDMSTVVAGVPIDTPAQGVAMEIADFDGDGAADALWLDDAGNLAITYLTSPAGTLAPALAGFEQTQVPDTLEVRAVADVDGLAGEEILLQDRDSYWVYMIAPSRQDLPPLVVMFDVREPFDLVHAQ